MNIKITAICGTALLLLLGAQAHAHLITGSFAGVAKNSERVEGVEMFGNFDGAAVNGTFGFESGGGSAFMSFAVPSLDVLYEMPAWITFQSNSIQLEYGTDITTPFGLLRLRSDTPLPLLGSAGHYTGINEGLFDPAVFVADWTAASFGRRRSPSGDVDVQSLIFDDASTGVPEPATLLLFGTGLLGVAVPAARRRRAKTPSV